MMARATALLGIVAVLGGCASTSGSSDGSPLSAHVNDFNQTVAEGAAIGALAGAAIGLIASRGDPRAMRRNVVTGAVAGGVVGAAGGYMIAGEKQAFAIARTRSTPTIDHSRDRVWRGFPG